MERGNFTLAAFSFSQELGVLLKLFPLLCSFPPQIVAVSVPKRRRKIKELNKKEAVGDLLDAFKEVREQWEGRGQSLGVELVVLQLTECSCGCR